MNIGFGTWVSLKWKEKESINMSRWIKNNEWTRSDFDKNRLKI